MLGGDARQLARGGAAAVGSSGMRSTAVALALSLTACAPATSQRALATAIVSKQLVEQAYEPWEDYVEAQVERCLIELPPAEHKKSEFDVCLGLALAHEKSVLPALEKYQVAALALYVSVTLDQSNEQVAAARRDLALAVAALVREIPAVNKQIERVRNAIGDE